MPFKGDLEDWPRFSEEWKHFCEQAQLDDIAKMRLVKRLLEGPARTMSQNYRDTSQDYHDLMKVMKRRFDQPEVVINFLNRKLRELPGPKRETASELRDFHNKIDAVCRQLRSAGCDVEHRSYSDQLLNKLSPQLLLYVKDKQMLTPPIEWNTRKLLDVIEDYVLRIEYIQNTTDGRSGGSNGDNNNKLDPPKRVYATNKLDPGYEAEDDASSIASEQSFPAPADKLYKPQAQPSTNKVMTLQEEQEDDTPQSVEDETRSIVEPISGSVSDHGFSDTEDEMCYNLMEADHGQPSSDQPEATRTLLMTTEVNVSNPSVPGDQLRCPILFDTASTNTLITQDLANKLNLPIEEENVHLPLIWRRRKGS
ncbi:gag protein [Aphelenchoides avenae]|nr:gag protein [Aphelenchus avenae]